MKKILLVAAIAAALCANAGVGATTNWVARYVREYVANAISNSVGEVSATTTSTTSNEVTTVTSGTAEVPIVMTITLPSIAALSASSVDSSVVSGYGITNGFLWAWNDSTERYEHSGFAPIVPTATNFVWNAVNSVSDNGGVVFKSGETTLFEVSGTFLTEAQANEIRGN